MGKIGRDWARSGEVWRDQEARLHLDVVAAGECALCGVGGGVDGLAHAQHVHPRGAVATGEELQVAPEGE